MRVAIGIAYDGTRFEGWQSQASGNTVQDEVERVLSEIAGHPVRVTAAGRTDTGVHATAQVAHFDTNAIRPDSAWIRGANALLPESIAVQWAVPVGESFHARFSAKSRSYRYLLYNHPVRPAVLARRSGWFHAPLNLAAMSAASRFLLGEHDFSAFRSSQCQAKTPVRTMHEAAIAQHGAYFVCTFKANAFLHHMVRNLVGCLVYVGKGKYPPERLGEILEGRNRALCAPTFAPDGLYLCNVDYGRDVVLPGFDPVLPLFPTRDDS